jgi:hypothetical protein
MRHTSIAPLNNLLSVLVTGTVSLLMMIVVVNFVGVRGESDNTPHITACQETIKRGSVVVSRDLFLHGWTFGKKEGVFVCLLD